MSLTESRLSRAASSTGTSTRTTTTRAQGSLLVRSVVGATQLFRAIARAFTAFVGWCASTVRPAGAVVAVAATVGLGLGVLFGWIEWLSAGVVALALLVMAVPFLFGARSYEVDLMLTHKRVVAGDSVAGELVVRNRGTRMALPGRIDIPVGAGLVEFPVPLLRAGHTVTQPLDIPNLRRGIVTIGPATTVRSDPIGMLRREHGFDDAHELYVHPRTVALPSMSAGLIRDLEGAPTKRLVDADMSFHAIREYVPGDSRRQVHWKSTAKTGRLMVRQYEESRRSRLAVVLASAIDEYADADEFELAVSCAASLGMRAVRDARDLDMVVGAEIPRVVRGRLRAIRHIPVSAPRVMLDGFSGVAALAATMALEDMCRLTTESNERLSIAVVVGGSKISLTRMRKAALAFPIDTAVVAVICDENAHPRMQTLPGLTVLTVGTIDDLAGLLMRGAGS